MSNELDLEETTIWSFPSRGEHLVSTSSFRGNWAPQIPYNLISRYSEPGDIVLDPFLGSGTTLFEAHRLGRRAVGLDINRSFVERVSIELKKIKDTNEQSVIVGDARNMNLIKKNTFDLVLLHPPYANAIIYSNIQGDLSHISNIPSFCNEMSSVITEMRRVSKRGAVLAIMIGDLRRKRKVVPLGFRILDVCLQNDLEIREIILKVQHNCASTERWRPIARRLNFLLLAHEYIFVFNNRK